MKVYYTGSPLVLISVREELVLKKWEVGRLVLKSRVFDREATVPRKSWLAC